MKKLFTLFVLLFCLTNLKAQTYVTIPDANFVTWLQTEIPSAMNGNQMDITSIAVTTKTNINVSSIIIGNLSGVQYFTSLKFLNCNWTTNLSSLPPLPSTLDSLFCFGTQMRHLPSLPPNLKRLHCGAPKLVDLPILPSSLLHLQLRSDTTIAIPTLPNNLIELSCTGMSSFPNILPALPSSLKNLYCGVFHIDSIPPLPNGLISLSCGMNSISSLPSLPNTLKYLDAKFTQITTFSNLPPSLIYFDCSGIPSLTLSSLPNELKSLRCMNSQLNTIPTLPDSLQILDCRNNQLSSLPLLPNGLIQLSCSSNSMTCIPTLPNSIQYLDIIQSNSITCLPNYISAMDVATLNYPLCVSGNTVTNPNGCSEAGGIEGSIYYDQNSDCIKNISEQYLANISMKLFDNTGTFLHQTTSFTNNLYNFSTTTGLYNVLIDTLNKPYSVQCTYPGIDSLVTLTSTQQMSDSVDFAVICKPGFDIGVQSVLTNGIVFPGQTHTLSVVAGDITQWYNLNCASGISGTVSFSVSGPVTYIGPAVGSLTPSVTGNVYTYTITDFGTINNANDFKLAFQTYTTALAGDAICINATVTPTSGDNNSTNNAYSYCYNVVNSHDPNIKEVYPINVIPGYHDWFTYTIHFQNTGNAPAFNIRLADSLDPNLDLETFEVINYSHFNNIDLNGRMLNVRFPNIQLPDSTSNPTGSIGFVQYRIKPKTNLPEGTKIYNTAYIYFDYNSPIVTNTTINKFTQALSVKELSNETNVTIYPNPTNGIVTIELSTKEKQKVQLIDITGNVVLSQNIENGKSVIDAGYLSAGIYNISIKGNSSVTNKKLIIVK